MAEESAVRDPEIEACRARIEGARQRLSVALADSRADRLLNPLDWRKWVQEYPVECTLGAAALGFLMAGEISSPGREGGGGLLEDLTRRGMETALRALLPPF